MVDVAWDASASYNGRTRTLEECVTAWKRDAQRARGALGAISTARVVTLEGVTMCAQDLTLRECMALAESLRDAYRERSQVGRLSPAVDTVSIIGVMSRA